MISDFIQFVSNNPAFRAGLFFVLGCCFGSFATALIYRIPRKLNWISDRSRCTSCNHTLGAVDLVPVLSWLFLRGQCRHCGARISVRYPLLEIGCGMLAALLSFLL